MESRIYGKEDQKLDRTTDGEGYNGRDSPKTPLGTGFVQSPNTQHPTIDTDGLSWPSKCTYQRQFTS
jgi:hypothetical protein